MIARVTNNNSSLRRRLKGISRIVSDCVLGVGVIARGSKRRSVQSVGRRRLLAPAVRAVHLGRRYRPPYCVAQPRRSYPFSRDLIRRLHGPVRSETRRLPVGDAPAPLVVVPDQVASDSSPCPATSARTRSRGTALQARRAAAQPPLGLPVPRYGPAERVPLGLRSQPTRR